MVEVKARKVNVPFKPLGRGTESVQVWVMPNEEKWEDGTSAYTVMPIEPYTALLPEGKAHIEGTTLTDRRAQVERFGVTSDSPLVSWHDLSRYGWGLDELIPFVPGDEPGQNKPSYWTVFFAQNVMRGLLTRIMVTEMKVLEADRQGEVFWTPWVEVLRNEVRAYDNIPPVRGISQFAAGQIKAMWRRVKDQVTEDNRKTLERSLSEQRGRILRMQHEEG